MKIIVDKATAIIAVCKMLNIPWVETTEIQDGIRTVAPSRDEIEFDFEQKPPGA